MAMRQLGAERQDESKYTVHMGIDLWYDTLRDPTYVSFAVPHTTPFTFFGLPVEVDERMPRGWIALRHEVTQ
jgi:hypothetical protein